MKHRFPRIVLFDETGLDVSTIKALRLVILAVAFGTISFNITGGIAMTGYLKTLGVSDFTFGLLYAIGPLASPLQLLASYVLERTRKRKLMFIAFGIVQRMSWLPFGLVPFFVPMNQPLMRVWMASLFMLVSAVSVPFMNVTFFSFAADLVPFDIRGRYFAVRSRISTMFGVAGGILTAWFLDMFSGFNSYALVFTLAAIAGTLDVICFFPIKFPPMAEQENNKGEKFSHMLVNVLKNKRYIKFILFMTLWQFSVNLSAPFYLVHLRNGVVLSNTLITLLIQILPNICSILIVTKWGRAIDSHGNKTIMRTANGILCIAPFLWIFTSNNAISVVLVAIIGLMQGFFLSGFDIGANNIMIGHAPKANRSMYIALYFTATSMIGVGAANATGGWLLDNVFLRLELLNLAPFGVAMTRYSYIFSLSAILRCVMIYIALPRLIHEDNNTPVREVLRSAYSSVKAMPRLIKDNLRKIIKEKR